MVSRAALCCASTSRSATAGATGSSARLPLRVPARPPSCGRGGDDRLAHRRRRAGACRLALRCRLSRRSGAGVPASGARSLRARWSRRWVAWDSSSWRRTSSLKHAPAGPRAVDFLGAQAGALPGRARAAGIQSFAPGLAPAPAHRLRLRLRLSRLWTVDSAVACGCWPRLLVGCRTVDCGRGSRPADWLAALFN